MKVDVLSVPSLISVWQLKEAIMADHCAFPVTNTANRLVGLIPRKMLIVLGKQKIFYKKNRCMHPENFESTEKKKINVHSRHDETYVNDRTVEKSSLRGH